MEKQNSVKFILGITFKLILISVITALTLSCVNALTADKIAENAAAEKAEAIASIFPESDQSEAADPTPEVVTALYLVYSNGEALGYAAEVAPLGFGGELTVMVGVNADGTIKGVKLISHSETPGLGSRVGEAEYLAQYAGKNGAALAGGVDVIAGSTVSSNAIRAGVESALSIYELVYPMLEGGAK